MTTDRQLPHIAVGGFEVTGLCDGYFRLDGGAMHGVVPRVLWERHHPPDEKNRILLALRGLLVRGRGATVVVEPGLGDRYSDVFRERFAIDRSTTLLGDLGACGVAPGQVDLVICTHLHWDHAGQATSGDGAGALEPTFPRATYVVQRLDWQEATHPHERNSGSYRPEDFFPLAETSQLRLIDGTVELLPGLRVERVGGHTAGLQIVNIGEGSDRLVFLSDLAPTAYHLDLPVIMGYDLYPVDTLEAKRRVLNDVIATGARVAFVHDPRLVFTHVTRDARGRPTVATGSL
ncbi:MAG: MBL fold metallo-hydrolase [Chloroflexi bacterium]|nr:MBL fold metallo-hydrolase [Chloroflexota bacterium]